MVRVSGDDGQPLEEAAEVKVYPGGGSGALFLMTADGGRAQFNQLTQGDYYIEVSAPGYKTSSGQSVNVEGRGMIYDADVHLEREAPSGHGMASTAGPILAPKAQRVEDKGVAALKTGNLADAQRYMEETLKLAPGNPNANFLLGYVFLQGKDLAQSEIYLMKAFSLDPKHVPTLVALGQLRLQQRDDAKAAQSLEAALAQDPDQWVAHWLMAGVYMQQQKFEDARQEAQHAIQSGKGAANGAELIMGEALAELGRKDEAIQSLESFLRDEPKNSSVPRAQALLATLKGGSFQPTNSAPAGATVESPVAAPPGGSASLPAPPANP